MTLAPVEINKAITVNINECLMPAFIEPSANFPIVSPVKSPCAKSRYSKGAAKASGVMPAPAVKSAFCKAFISLKLLKEPNPLPPVKGRILNSKTSIIPINIKNIMYP